jgi:hypothetical protein
MEEKNSDLSKDASPLLQNRLITYLTLSMVKFHAKSMTNDIEK